MLSLILPLVCCASFPGEHTSATVSALQIDTPSDMPARDRFARYRGLKSFRSSPWDAREGLPQEYATTFAFENFKRAHKRCAISVVAQLHADLCWHTPTVSSLLQQHIIAFAWKTVHACMHGAGGVMWFGEGGLQICTDSQQLSTAVWKVA